MSEPMMRKVEGDGVSINIAEWEGQGPPILCIHGITANCRCWDVMASVLAPEHRVIAMDLRGRGRSDKPESGYAIETHVRDIICLLDDLNLPKAAIMGHSLGAFIGLALSAGHPDRVERLVLVDGGGDLSKEQMDQVFEGIKPALDRLQMVFPSSEAYLEKMASAPYIQPWSPAIEAYYRYEIQSVDDGFRTNIQAPHIQEEAANVRKLKCADFYPEVKCATLILRAPNGLLSQADILLPEPVIATMTAEIPTVERFDVDGVNHYGIVFQPHSGRDQAVLDFLSA